MLKFLLAAVGLAMNAEEFSLQIASAVAGQSFQTKHAAFVARQVGCEDASKLTVSAVAEGLSGGKRRTLPIKTLAVANSPAYAVFREWPVEGTWVVHLRGSCGSAVASALVVPGERGPNREASKFFNRDATERDIQALLQSVKK